MAFAINSPISLSPFADIVPTYQHYNTFFKIHRTKEI
jgi:hypothetical protein